MPGHPQDRPQHVSEQVVDVVDERAHVGAPAVAVEEEGAQAVSAHLDQPHLFALGGYPVQIRGQPVEMGRRHAHRPRK